MGDDRNGLTQELLQIVSIPLHMVTAPACALAGLALRTFGCGEVLKRLAYDQIDRDPRTVIWDGGRYFTANEEERFKLARQCIARALEIGDIPCIRSCLPRQFGVEDPNLKMELYRLVAAYGEPSNNSGIFGGLDAEDMKTLPREFRVDMLSSMLYTANAWHFVEKLDLDDLGKIQAHKRGLDTLRGIASEWREQGGPRRFFPKLDIEDIDSRIALAREYMEVVPETTCRYFRRLNLSDAPGEVRFELAMQGASAGCARIIHDLSNFELGPDQKKQVIRRVLETNASGALGYLDSEIFPLDRADLEELFTAALERGSWSNAVKICELQRTGNRSVAGHLVVRDDFGRLLAQVRPRLSFEIAKSLDAVIATGCFPTDGIGSSLKRFGAPHREFLLQILTSYGESFGGSVLNELESIFPDGAISARQQKCVNEFLATGFRGFSSLAFERFQQAWEESPVKAAGLIRNWKELSSQILSGKPLTPELRDDAMLAEFIYAAYRPAMTLQDVKWILPRQEDFSGHCGRFAHPDGGYPVQVREVALQGVKEGESFDRAGLRSHIERLTDCDPDNKFAAGDLVKLGVRALQGDFDGLRKRRGELLQYLIGNSNDGQPTMLVAGIRESLKKGLGPAEIVAAIPKMTELQGVVFKDLIEARLRELVDNGEFVAGAKLTDRVRTILKLPKGAPVGRAETLAALEQQFCKLFAEDQRFLKDEQKKVAALGGESKLDFELILTKSLASYFGRSGAGLCTAQDNWSWGNRDFLQMIMVDRKAERIVGNIQLHLFTDPEGRSAVIARLNPTESLLARTDKHSLAQAMIGAVQKFSRENNLLLYLPEQTASHLLTNRHDFLAPLRAYYGAPIDCKVQLTGSYTCTRAYRCLDAPSAAPVAVAFSGH